ncbi:hypothetical protein CC86DRAFT_405290 [Ophiobolus disseminans]|uniref:Uncharacterized protein n=1 Tax=Ophiobolus disseminans TaxID=1469910 RepID=A0A6A7A6H3_9PLEO|nr:hypothetical protein CC86DRAFT_405290 [Ophiobolus disseminans]
MHFSLAKACIALLAFGQALGVARAYPSQTSTTLDQNFSHHDNQSSKGNDEETPIERRALEPKLTSWGQGSIAATWTGSLKEPAKSGWTENTIDEYAANAWKQTQYGSDPAPILVAALWVPGVGLYLGSIPHGDYPGSTMTAQARMDSLIRAEAPLLWQQVQHRTSKGTPKWHAEDTAMLMYERSACKTTASNLHGRLALSNTILSSPKVIEAKALMQHAVPLGLVEPAVRSIPFALLTRFKVKDADRSSDSYSVPPRGAPADSTHSKAVGADLLGPLALTPATV